MTCYLAIYHCAFGHRHRITVPNPPFTLAIVHGRDVGKPPACRAPLRLVRAEPL